MRPSSLVEQPAACCLRISLSPILDLPRPGTRVSGVVGLVLSFALALLGAPVGPVHAAEKVWVELETPTQELTTFRSPVNLIEIRGWTGTGLRGGHDVLIAIDRSTSVWKASGSDIDEDGTVGRQRPGVDLILNYDQTCTDPGDTILQAEISAARKLIERLDPKTTRMGLMSFAGGARVHAPIGSSQQELYDALIRLPTEPDSLGTSFDTALKLARLQFEGNKQPANPEDRRNLAIILLSDGSPTSPPPIEHAEAFAVLSAQDAAKLGVRIYAFALGPDAVANRNVYERITQVSGGELVLVANPGEVTDFVPHVSLTKIARVEIDNLSSSQSARAVRLFPDGSFDGYAPLREGKNILRITAYGEDGYESVVDRTIYFEKETTESETARQEKERMLRDLKVRTLETELAENARERMKQSSERYISVETQE